MKSLDGELTALAPSDGDAAGGGLGHNKIARWLADGAAAAPEKVLVHSIDQDKSITWSQMQRLARRIGQYLRARSVGTNDRIVLLSGNCIEHLAVYYSVMAYGATICTIQVDMNEAHLGDILRSLGPKMILVESGVDTGGFDAGGAEMIDLGDWRPDGGTEGGIDGGSGFFAGLKGLPDDQALRPVNGDDDIASIFYTSGTTSKPKGIVCNFRDLCQNVEGTAAVFGIGEADRILDYRSFNWMSAQVLSGLSPLAGGATLLLARKFSRGRFFGWIRDHQATIAAGNPTVINMLINRPEDIDGARLPDLRYITSSSAPLMVRDWEKFEEMYGITVVQGYGTSETGWIAGAHEANRRLGSVGKPIPYQNLWSIDADGKRLPPGETGSIELGDGGGEAVQRRFAYLGEDGAPKVNALGRVTTGDFGHLDADGYLYVSGREKDLIIRGGVNISPVEIDNLLIGLEGVADAAAIGVPDPIWGEEVVAYVVAEAGAELSPEELISQLKDLLPEAKLPKSILLRDALPKSERGKLDRQALRDAWQTEYGGGH
ncbi:MAG: class I adenylate-forming enzyme family protein [Rhodospirillales bacterium]|jgi:acyl-CoA synthetase (AMP-forming)/AMP-acid ligase II|nr:class I adenylate-forming enzyme family protein [Rhodospirillales bacterium]